MTDVVEELNQDFNMLINGTEDIGDLLSLWASNNNVVKQAKEREEKLRTKVKVFLKERSWERYLDKNTNISVTISKQKRESFDKEKLKQILTESQLVQATKITTFEKLNIITPEIRKRLKNYVRQQKKLY